MISNRISWSLCLKHLKPLQFDITPYSAVILLQSSFSREIAKDGAVIYFRNNAGVCKGNIIVLEGPAVYNTIVIKLV